MKASFPSFTQTVEETLRLYKLSFLPVIFVFIAFGIIGFVLAVMLVLLMVIAIKALLSLGLLGGVVIFLLSLLAITLFMAANTLGTLTSILIINTKDRKEAVNIWAIAKSQFKNVFPYLVVSFLSGITAFAGTLIFIIPGIILSFWFSLAIYVLIFENQKGIKALITSRDLVRGKVFKLALYTFVFSLITGIIQWLIGYLLQQVKVGYLAVLTNILTFPLSTIYFYVIYKYLNSKRGNMPEITSGRVNKYKLLAAAPVVLLIGVIFIAIYTLDPDFTVALWSLQRQLGF